MTDQQAKYQWVERPNMRQVATCSGQPTHMWLRYRIRNYVKAKLMTFWCRYLYRHVMRLLHRFDLHYAPARVPIDGNGQTREHWCQWCGLRGNTYVYTRRIRLDD